MKRGKRIAFTVAATGLAVVLVVGILYRGAVRGHVEAWWFQVTRETFTIEPEPKLKGVPGTLTFHGTPFAIVEALPITTLNDRALFCLVANHTGISVVFDPAAATGFLKFREEYYSRLTSDGAIKSLESNGWRFLEQRFPRRAYVVIPPKP
jgi:hypothetical protein